MMNRDVVYSKQFQRDLKRADKRRYDLTKLEKAIALLQTAAIIPRQYDKHPLAGEYSGCLSLTLAPDWRLIYYIDGECVNLMRTGTHSDLYKR
jgi:mRNA interferase YafQ